MAAKDELGRQGEQVAVDHLEKSGMTVLARNWRCARGELDVVARTPEGTIVFAEVKTRSSDAFGLPAEAVGAVKARRIRELALRWLQEADPRSGDLRFGDLRFDVVSIVMHPGRADVLHLPGAF